MSLFAAGFVALSLAACAAYPAPAPDVTRIVATTSFGMCVGYCTTRLELSDGQAVLVREARGGRGGGASQPAQRFSTPLTPDEWRELRRLAAAADFGALPDVVGCPDCADGGAEGLSVEGANGTESVAFEYGARLPPAQPLLDRVRALRQRLTPEEAG
jgi:hypothetical protein